MKNNNDIDLRKANVKRPRASKPESIYYWKWLVLGAGTLIIVAIIAEKYFHDLNNLQKESIDKSDSPSCDTQLHKLKLDYQHLWKNSYLLDFDRRIKGDLKNINDEMHKCQKAFIELLNEDNFFPNVILSKKLGIVLLSESVTGGGYGLYDPTTYTIGIVYRPHTTVQQYKRYLSNEFFSHQVQMINELKGIKASPMVISCPILDKKGKVSQQLLKELENAINVGIERVTSCKIYLLNYVNKYDENNRCNDILVYAKDYDPNIYYLTEKNYQESLAAGITTPLDTAGRFESGPNHANYLSKCYGKKHHNQFTYTYAKDGTPLNKAIALLGDIFTQYLMMYNPEGPYHNKPHEQKVSEAASFLAEYPKKILQFLFPEFYNITCKFFTNIPGKLPEYLPQKNIEREITEPALKNKKELLFFNEKTKHEKPQPTNQKHTTTRVPQTARKSHPGAR